MGRRISLGIVAFALLATGCSSDPTESDEYAELERQLATVTAERDALLAEKEATRARYENALANQETMGAIIADPHALGTEEEVLDLLDSMATPYVVSGDLAFGGTRRGIWRTGWRNTLFGSDDMTVKTWRDWLSDDGSVGGSLWTWYGTATNGENFAIPGVEVSRFNDEGLWEELVMFYPFEDEEVHRRVAEGN